MNNCDFPIWLVVSTPLKNMSSSIGMIIPNIWKHKSHVPVTTNQMSNKHQIAEMESVNHTKMEIFHGTVATVLVASKWPMLRPP